MTRQDQRDATRDSQDNFVGSVTVELRGESLSGLVKNGQQVEVRTGHWKGGTLQTREVTNLSTEGTLSAERAHNWPQIVAGIIVITTGWLA